MQKIAFKLGACALGAFLCSLTGLHAQSFGNSTNSANGGFELLTENNYTWYGAAVGFTPTENINVASVTLWLNGYDAAANFSGIGVSIYGTYTNIPGSLSPNSGTANTFPWGAAVVTFSSPASNDGSSAAFTLNNLAGATTLQAGTEYWLMVLPEVKPNGLGGHAFWDSGGTPQGDAIYDGSDFVNQYQGYYDSNTNTPAFAINEAPEPSVCSILVLSGLVLANRVIWKRR